MSDPDLQALQAAMDAARRALGAAETEKKMRLISAAHPKQLKRVQEITEDPTEAPTASPAALHLAAQHLGLRPLQNPASALLTLADVLKMPPERASEKLRALTDSWQLKGRLSRVQCFTEREALLLLAGVIVACM